jgi:transformation/transcription domain-associated protein
VDLKDILETWRLRTPNEWDELTVWTDLLQWRNHMYDIVINAFKGFSETNQQLHQLGYRDKAWSVNKLAFVARRQGLYEVCVKVLNNMYGFLTMDVQVWRIPFCLCSIFLSQPTEITHILHEALQLTT